MLVACGWGGGHAITMKKTETWIHVCAEKLHDASISATGKAPWDDVGSLWVNK